MSYTGGKSFNIMIFQNVEAKIDIAERRQIGKIKKKINYTRQCPRVLVECFCIPFEFLFLFK